MDGSKMLRDAFGDDVIDHYVHTAKWEQFEYDRRITDWELKRGFERYYGRANIARWPSAYNPSENSGSGSLPPGR